jgi:hypothetical protein
LKSTGGRSNYTRTVFQPIFLLFNHIAMLFKEYLMDVNGEVACKRGRDLVGDKTLSEFWDTSERGDDMCWLLFHAKLCDIRTLTKIKALQADLVKHLMRDKRSLAALQAAHDFGNGLIDADELARLAAYAYAAAAAADAAAAYAAYSAAAYAAYATYAAYSAAAAAAYSAAADDATNARAETLKKCADIVREVIPSVSIEGVE